MLNPPKILNIGPELLDLAERAMHKYLASGDTDPQVAAIVTSMLLGEQWTYTAIPHDFPPSKKWFFHEGLHWITPSRFEVEGEEADERPEWNHMACVEFKKYLYER